MAIIHPFNYSIEDIEADHGHAEAYIIRMINNLDQEKTKDWVFYYSFSFKSKTLNRFKDCEIDFLCLLPNIGVFVFEVKGGKISKALEDGEPTYYSLDRFGQNNPIKNPYDQARSNFSDFCNLLRKSSPQESDLVLYSYVGGSAVGFPDMEQVDFYDPNGPDGVLTYTKRKDFYQFLINLGKYYTTPSRKVPTKEDIDYIIKCFSLKNFTYKYDLGDYIDTTNVRINQLTDEQYTVLRGLLENDRCLINGPAGSGKTVLSEMLFKYFVNNHEKVAYFSYNVFNSLKVRGDLEVVIKETKSLCAPLYDYIDELINKYYPNKVFNNYQEKIKSLLQVRDKPDFPKYSVIIIDEAQDLDGNEDLIDLFDNFASRGLKDGKVFIFYDKHQTVFYNNSPFYDNDIFGNDGFRYAKFSLEKNCRNSENISNLLEVMRHQKGKLLIKNVHNDSVTYLQVKNKEECFSSINKIVKYLKDNGVDNKSITILLSSHKINESNSPINQIQSELNKNKTTYKEYSVTSGPSLITYTTVRKFKGLENDVVIYIRHYASNASKYTQNDDYVAVSRGKSLVYILDINGE